MSRQKKRKTYNTYTYEDGNTVRRLEAVPGYQEERKIRKEERREADQKRRRRRAARRNRERALKMSAGYVAFLSICVTAVAFISIMYVKLQSDVYFHQQKTEQLEREISDLKMENDSAYKRITTSADLKAVKKQAKKFGMKYPSEKQIIYYTIDNSDYMTQYTN